LTKGSQQRGPHNADTTSPNTSADTPFLRRLRQLSEEKQVHSAEVGGNNGKNASFVTASRFIAFSGRDRLINRHIKRIFFLCLLGIFAAWLTWPTAGQLELESCSPNGAVAELSAYVHGKGFWRAQLGDIGHQRDEAENWDRTQAEQRRQISEVQAQTDEVLQREKDWLATFYAPSQEHQLAEQLRDRAAQMMAQADDLEMKKYNRLAQEKIQKQLPILRRCQEFINKKLR